MKKLGLMITIILFGWLTIDSFTISSTVVNTRALMADTVDTDGSNGDDPPPIIPPIPPYDKKNGSNNP